MKSDIRTSSLAWSPLTDRYNQPVRKAVNDRGLFTAGWFGVREKHCSRLEIYDRLRASEQAGEQAVCIQMQVLVNVSSATSCVSLQRKQHSVSSLASLSVLKYAQ